jgi:hypothetical protein
MKNNGENSLHGPLPDPAALFGILNQLRNLAVPLVSVQGLALTGWPGEYMRGAFPLSKAFPSSTA